ncbi:MAG: hypothetical protein IPJ20_19940 [Flammeovirgaceae bacterium]|nr:hypothetical protein [Flammeovirgaceae bacterium]
MSRKSIVVNLPEIDSTTNKRKKVIHDYLIIKNNLEMRHAEHNPEFTAGDGSNIGLPMNFNGNYFLPKQITKETDGNLTNPLTGIQAVPDSLDAITELNTGKTST